jgi:hypothetical protein
VEYGTSKVGALSLENANLREILEINVDENRMLNYSTEEVVIGTWYDGKTLYRKAIEVTLEGGTVYEDSREFVYNPNVGSIKNCYGSFHETRTGGSFECLFGTPSFYADLKLAISSYIDNNKLYIRTSNEDCTKIETHLIIEYTKD